MHTHLSTPLAIGRSAFLTFVVVLLCCALSVVSCNITPDGLTAIMKLAGGDMRKSLNVMQACHMAYSEINENNVYACTGNPLPSDLKLMLNMLNNQPIKQAFEGQPANQQISSAIKPRLWPFLRLSVLMFVWCAVCSVFPLLQASSPFSFRRVCR